MSKIKAPIYSYKNPVIYYKLEIEMSDEKFGNFYLGPQTSYGNSEGILGCQLILIIPAKLDLISANNFSAKLDLILIISAKIYGRFLSC